MMDCTDNKQHRLRLGLSFCPQLFSLHRVEYRFSIPLCLSEPIGQCFCEYGMYVASKIADCPQSSAQPTGAASRMVAPGGMILALAGFVGFFA